MDRIRVEEGRRLTEIAQLFQVSVNRPEGVILPDHLLLGCRSMES